MAAKKRARRTVSRRSPRDAFEATFRDILGDHFGGRWEVERGNGPALTVNPTGKGQG